MADFLAAWELFGDAWTVGLLLAALLPIGGIVLVLRRQVFLAAAIGQTSTLGIALAIFLGLGAHEAPGHAHAETWALGFALVAGVLTAVTALRALSQGGAAMEARAGWMFLLGGSASMLLLAERPHGLQEVQRLQLSSLLGASPADVWICAVVLAVIAAVVIALGRRLLLWAIDPTTARVLGMACGRWDVAVGGWLGLVSGFAIHATGLLFVFGLTILPVLFAAQVCRRLGAVLVVAPMTGLLATAVALAVAHLGDLPPGQVAVALLAGAVLLARLIRRGFEPLRWRHRSRAR
ncbi:MAG: metal ABC transporter permease [Planctomycetes bacterium]|nr:metal ABC transporter permease [Planctomycetota bacterium]